MFSKTSALAAVMSYEAAHTRFNKTPISRRAGWTDMQRPLCGPRAWHYRIERAQREEAGLPPAYYDICLYHTTMVRYYRPLEDGHRRVSYTNHYSMTSKSFLSRVCNVRNVLYLRDTQGTQRYVPVAYTEMGTTLWHDATGALVVDRSRHAPIVALSTPPDKKAWLSTVRVAYENIFTLLELRAESPRVEQMARLQVALLNTAQCMHRGEPLQEVHIEALCALFATRGGYESDGKARTRRAVMYLRSLLPDSTFPTVRTPVADFPEVMPTKWAFA